VAPDLLGFLTREGSFTDTNPAWLKTLDFTAAEVLGRSFMDFIHPEDLDSTRTALVRINNGFPLLNIVNRFRCKDGSYEWLSWNVVPEEGYFFCSARYITAEKKNEAALRTHEEEVKLRDQFIAVLGHDVRNPLAAINAAARMIGRSAEDSQTQDMVASIMGSTGRIANLIDDVMDFTRAQLGGGLNIDWRTSHDVTPILEQTVREISLAHPETEILTEYSFCDPVYCDAGRISQLKSNLVANAVVHGAPITVSAKDRDSSFYLWVTNLGEPIPENIRHMLFEPFVRSNVRQSQNGLGFGLFIAREMARGNGGDLTMTSDAE